MFNIRRYSTADHEEIWGIHLLVIAAAGVEPTHQHYHDIFHIDDHYLESGGDFFVGTGQNGVVIAMGGLKKLDEELPPKSNGSGFTRTISSAAMVS